MGKQNQKRTILIIVIVLILLLILLLVRCQMQPAPRSSTPAESTPPSTVNPSRPAAIAPTVEPPAEKLDPATLTVPARAPAGSSIRVDWTGPDNPGDYITIVAPEAQPDVYGNYRETRDGSSIELTVPMTPGMYECRYIAARSKVVLGRAAITIDPVSATLDAPGEVVLGSAFSVRWTGPNNQGDYVTIVPSDAPDDQFKSYTMTARGSPLELTAPTSPGPCEIRYIAGQNRAVLARRSITITPATVSLQAPDTAIAGAIINVTWEGPNNSGDYITVVPAGTSDGNYGNYSNTSQGSPLKLLLPILDGPAEIRYMTGKDAKVLTRRDIRITAAAITLEVPEQCTPGAQVSITWMGPNHGGDYITIVPKSKPDGQYEAYTNTTAGSPLTVKAPTNAGEAEVRYMSGQGNKVLARAAIRVAP